MRQRSGVTSRVLLGALLATSVTGLLTIPRAPRSGSPEARPIAPSVAVQRSFQHFADSLGTRLLDTLFALGYHGGYTWDETGGARRANLIVRSEWQTASDSVADVNEATLTLDFHHDSVGDVPPTVSLRFASARGAADWVLLTSDGYPEDQTQELSQEAIHNMPPALHDALQAPFANRIDSYDWWKNHESRRRADRSPQSH